MEYNTDSRFCKAIPFHPQFYKAANHYELQVGKGKNSDNLFIDNSVDI